MPIRKIYCIIKAGFGKGGIKTEQKKRVVLGITAHVDAGKTTLSEALLFAAGETRKRGRVDDGSSCLDTDKAEKARGITVFAHRAEFEINCGTYTLLDTPGHVDFSAETERTF